MPVPVCIQNAMMHLQFSVVSDELSFLIEQKATRHVFQIKNENPE